MATKTIDPIVRSTLSSTVTERLRELIAQGAYPPGTQLSEVELAERFGVSRGPIREALQRLVQEGLLRSEPHRGTTVPVISDEDIADIYLARLAMERAAVRIVAARGEQDQVARSLLKFVRDMKRAAAQQRWSTVADLDLRFHLEVVNQARSPRLSRMYATLIDETRVLLSLTVYPIRNDLVDEHDALARHLEAGDIESALGDLHQHYTATQRGLLEDHSHPADPFEAAAASAG